MTPLDKTPTSVPLHLTHLWPSFSRAARVLNLDPAETYATLYNRRIRTTVGACIHRYSPTERAVIYIIIELMQSAIISPSLKELSDFLHIPRSTINTWRVTTNRHSIDLSRIRSRYANYTPDTGPAPADDINEAIIATIKAYTPKVRQRRSRKPKPKPVVYSPPT